MFFSLNKTAQKPDEVLVVDLHKPAKFLGVVPYETLSSADVIDAVEEWLTIPPAMSYWLCWMIVIHSSKHQPHLLTALSLMIPRLKTWLGCADPPPAPHRAF